MNIGSIIILLQLVLSLLSNPVTAQNPQVQALAGQALVAAKQALSIQPIQPPIVVTPPIQPIVTPPVPQNTSGNPSAGVTFGVSNPTSTPISLGKVQATPSCTITATITKVYDLQTQNGPFNGGEVALNWNPADVSGTLDTFAITQNGIYDIGSPLHDNYLAPLTPGKEPLSWGIVPIYKAHFINGATCYAYLADYSHDGGFPMVGDVSTSKEPVEYASLEPDNTCQHQGCK